MRAFVLATGPSLTHEQVDAVRGRGLVIAVSDAYRWAPWADILCSTDAEWWQHHEHAKTFAGRKVCACENVAGVEQVRGVPRSVNSGLLACEVAVLLGCTSIVLLGLDNKGSHFFGDHPAPLTNSQAHHYAKMRDAFEYFAGEVRGRVDVWNCSPDSALMCFPKRDLSAILAE